MFLSSLGAIAVLACTLRCRSCLVLFSSGIAAVCCLFSLFLSFLYARIRRLPGEFPSWGHFSNVVPLSRDGMSSCGFPSAVPLPHGVLSLCGRLPISSGARDFPTRSPSLSGCGAPRPVFAPYAVSSVLRPALSGRLLRGPLDAPVRAASLLSGAQSSRG